MDISVVIPVYNAAGFITQAVESALAQPETAEVILIEDGSSDDSLAVCQALANKHEKVHLFRHPGGDNRGTAASRNLAMKKAQYNFIAFLDADDYYLPGRFEVTNEIFSSEPDSDGVYEAMGIHYDSNEAKQHWRNSQMATIENTTMTKRVTPEQLFPELLSGDSGYFSICGLVIKIPILRKVGFMSEDLHLHEDTDFIYRLSVVGKLMPGELDEPVVIRRVHEQNRISAPRSEQQIYHDRILQYKATYKWLRKNGYKKQSITLLIRMVRYSLSQKPLPYSWMVKLRKLLHDSLKNLYN
jgi:glycosyltransferase involved in cell wall biosynthesis